MGNDLFHKAKCKIANALIDDDIDDCPIDYDTYALCKIETFMNALSTAKNQINEKVKSLNKNYNEDETIPLKQKFKKVLDDIDELYLYLSNKHRQYVSFSIREHQFSPTGVNIIHF